MNFDIHESLSIHYKMQDTYTRYIIQDTLLKIHYTRYITLQDTFFLLFTHCSEIYFFCSWSLINYML